MGVGALQAILLGGAILFLAATGAWAEKIVVPGAGGTGLKVHIELPGGPGPHPAQASMMLSDKSEFAMKHGWQSAGLFARAQMRHIFAFSAFQLPSTCKNVKFRTT